MYRSSNIKAYSVCLMVATGFTYNFRKEISVTYEVTFGYNFHKDYITSKLHDSNQNYTTVDDRSFIVKNKVSEFNILSNLTLSYRF